MTQVAERAVTGPARTAMITGSVPLIDVAGHLGGNAESSRKAAAASRWAFENEAYFPRRERAPALPDVIVAPGARAIARW